MDGIIYHHATDTLRNKYNRYTSFKPWRLATWTVGYIPLHWRHNELDGVSNHQPNDCLLNLLFRRRSKETPKFRVTGLCAGNSPETGEFPAQRASNAENLSIWWRHHAMKYALLSLCFIFLQLYCLSSWYWTHATYLLTLLTWLNSLTMPLFCWRIW